MNPYRLKIRLLNFCRMGRLTGPLSVNIELSTACNRSCLYCPQHYEDRKQEIVTPQFWELFTVRLKEFGWRGTVWINGLSEPTLIPGIGSYIISLRSIGCLPCMFSNGDRPDVLRQCLNEGLAHLVVTQHFPSSEAWLYPVQRIKREYPFRVRLTTVGKAEDRCPTNWAGQIPYGHKHALTECAGTDSLAFDRFGNAALCCMDYRFRWPVGNLWANSLQEIWDGYSDLRYRVRTAQWPLPICRECLREGMVR